MLMSEETDSDIVTLRLIKKVRRAKKDIKCLLWRRQHLQTSNFNFNRFSTLECLRHFRFRPNEIGIISGLVQFSGVTKEKKYTCDPFIATCIMLKRISFPCRWYDLEEFFFEDDSKISEIYWNSVKSFFNLNRHLAYPFRSSLLNQRAEIYATSIRNAGSPLPHCVGFIDGTRIEMERPGGPNENQRSCYSYKKRHCLAYITMTTPDGLVFFANGPVEGRRNDLFLMATLGLDDALRDNLLIDYIQYYVYGDAIFQHRPYLQIAYDRTVATAMEQLFNTQNNRVRTSVEWSYKDVKQMFTSQDFKRSLKCRQSPVGLLYLTSVILWNIKVVLHGGGQVGRYFQCNPPTLSEYLNQF